MSSNCTNCGAPLVSTARFCTSCGAVNPGFVDPAGATRASERIRPETAEPADQQAAPAPDYPASTEAPVVEPPTAPYQAVPPQSPMPAAPVAGFTPPSDASPYGAPNEAAAPAAPGPDAWAQPAQPYAEHPTHQFPSQPMPTQPGQHGFAPGTAFAAGGYIDGQAPAKKSRKGLIALICGLVLLLAAGGAGAWWFLLRDSDESPNASVERSDQPLKAIAEAPEQAWSWEVPEDSYVGVFDNKIVVSSADGVRVFGADDQPVWSNKDISRLSSADTTNKIGWGRNSDDEAVIFNLADGSIVTTIDDWQTYWSLGDGRMLLVQRDGTEYDDPITAARVVDHTGKQVYELPVFDALEADEESLYLIHHEGTIKKVDRKDGKEVWTQEVPSWELPDPEATDSDREWGPSFALLEGMGALMALTKQDTLEVRDLETGEVTKTISGVNCDYLSQNGPTTVSCQAPVDYSADDYDPDAERVTHFYDNTGEIGSISSQELDFYSAFEVTAGQDAGWYLTSSRGRIYDAQFKEIAQISLRDEKDDYSRPTVRPNDSGLYVVRDDKLEMLDTKADVKWSVDVPGDGSDEASYPSLVATDDLIAVQDKGTLTTWKR